MRYVSEKSTSNVKMANNKLQVSIIKITESSKNNSIHRLDVSGLTGPGGGGGGGPPAAPLAPLLAMALTPSWSVHLGYMYLQRFYGHWKFGTWDKIV